MVLLHILSFEASWLQVERQSPEQRTPPSPVWLPTAPDCHLFNHNMALETSFSPKVLPMKLVSGLCFHYPSLLPILPSIWLD